MDIRTAAFAVAALAALASTPSMAAVDCQVEPLLREATNLERALEVVDSSWIDVAPASGPRTALPAKQVAKDDTVLSLRFSTPPNMLVATTPFTFKSPWPLNPKFTFQVGDSVRIRGIVTSPADEQLYVLQGTGPFGNRIVFARMDGTLCSKVINPGRPANFLPKEFSMSDPAARLEIESGESPVVVKVVYLGASGGTAKYREIWSMNGRLREELTHEIDTDATEFAIAAGGLRLTQSKPTATSVRISTPAIPERVVATERMGLLLQTSD